MNKHIRRFLVTRAPVYADVIVKHDTPILDRTRMIFERYLVARKGKRRAVKQFQIFHLLYHAGITRRAIIAKEVADSILQVIMHLCFVLRNERIDSFSIFCLGVERNGIVTLTAINAVFFLFSHDISFVFGRVINIVNSLLFVNQKADF
jgi:hypothetical protein